MEKQLVFLGAPGTGKGTQAKKLVQECGFVHLSTGDLLRDEVKKGTPLGKKVEDILNAGDLVSDDVVIELLKANCDLQTKRYIFDGFPRNDRQALMLEEALLGTLSYDAVYFEMPLDKLLARLTNRRSCPSCGQIYNLLAATPKVEDTCDSCGHKGLLHRKDDHEDVVSNRLKVFSGSIGPILKFYEEKRKLVKIDANQGPQEVFNHLKSLI